MTIVLKNAVKCKPYYENTNFCCSRLPVLVIPCTDGCCVCVIELSRAHPDAPLFTENGIDVMTVKEFVRGFMGKVIEHQANTKFCQLSFLTYDSLL